MVTRSNEAQPTVPVVPVWKLNVAQYHRMISSGILSDDDPVELLTGWLVQKMPKNPPHRIATKVARNQLEKLIPAGYYVDSQEPITLAAADSEPEPDVVVVRGDTRDYLDRHPTEQDVVLVVEVSDTTYDRDRDSKYAIYAQVGIPVYWIINLPKQQIEVYTAPITLDGVSTYQDCQILKQGEFVQVTIVGLDVGKLAVQDLLP